MKKIAAVLALLLAGCATGRQPFAPPGNARQISLQIGIDTKGVPLGAYQLVVVFEPGDARIIDIHATHGSDFPGTPQFDRGVFAKGSVRVTGYSTRGPVPPAPYKLITVLFEQVGHPVSPVSVNVERVYDTSRPPKEIRRFDVILSRTALDFTRGD